MAETPEQKLKRLKDEMDRLQKYADVVSSPNHRFSLASASPNTTTKTVSGAGPGAIRKAAKVKKTYQEMKKKEDRKNLLERSS